MRCLIICIKFAVLFVNWVSIFWEKYQSVGFLNLFTIQNKFIPQPVFFFFFFNNYIQILNIYIYVCIIYCYYYCWVNDLTAVEGNCLWPYLYIIVYLFKSVIKHR